MINQASLCFSLTKIYKQYNVNSIQANKHFIET